jgi:putative membrane protein
MAKRLWFIITWPSAILAVIFAVWLLILQPSWLNQGWMHIKLLFVVLLIFYHLKTHQFFLQLQKDYIRYSSNFMRIWNEGATLFLFAIVFLAILKNSINWIFGVLGIVLLAVMLMLAIRLYKRIREKNPNA